MGASWLKHLGRVEQYLGIQKLKNSPFQNCVLYNLCLNSCIILEPSLLLYYFKIGATWVSTSIQGDSCHKNCEKWHNSVMILQLSCSRQATYYTYLNNIFLFASQLDMVSKGHPVISKGRLSSFVKLHGWFRFWTKSLWRFWLACSAKMHTGRWKGSCFAWCRNF